jgi:hypothetical protein
MFVCVPPYMHVMEVPCEACFVSEQYTAARLHHIVEGTTGKILGMGKNPVQLVSNRSWRTRHFVLLTICAADCFRRTLIRRFSSTRSCSYNSPSSTVYHREANTDVRSGVPDAMVNGMKCTWVRKSA